MLLPHGLLGIHQGPQVLFCRSAFQVVIPYTVLVPGDIRPQMQDFLFPFIELHEIPVGFLLSFLRSIWLPLQLAGVSATPLSSCHQQTCTLDALCPIIQVTNEVVKWYWPQCWSLGCTSSDFLPAGLHADHNSLSLAVQLDFSPSHCLFV